MIEKKYTQPLQVVATPEMRDRVKAIADRRRISQAAVIREALEVGLPELERQDGVGRV